MSLSPPDGFRTRPATEADVSAINALCVAADEAVMGWSDSTEADLLDWWRLIDLEQDSWLAENGSVAAYGTLFLHGDIAELDGYVHPDQKGKGLGRWLIERGQERTRERGLQNGADVVSRPGRCGDVAVREARLQRGPPLLPDACRARHRAARAGVAGRISCRHVRARRRA